MDEYDIAKLYQEMELELIASLKRNLLRHELKEIEENMEYPQWQALKLRDIQRIKRENQDIIGKYTSNIPKDVKKIIKEEYKQGRKEAIALFNDANRGKKRLNESFFKTNNKKVKAMIDEINGTFKEAEKAIFRMTNDVYRKTIFKAGFYLSHGAVNLKQAINIAIKDFAKRGINCIEYKDGRRINIADYARMAVRTASQRSRLMAEGDFRKRLKRTLVKITKHGTSCKYCKVYEQQILVDDVYSGGVPDGKHELLSSAMSKGLFHPNCRHKAPTYYEELDELKYEQMAKSATAKEEEERKKDLFSQKEQRKRRVRLLETNKIQEKNNKKHKKYDIIEYEKVDQEIEDRLQRKSDLVWDKLNDEPKYALMEYSKMFYISINNYLRDSSNITNELELKKVKKCVSEIDKVLSNNNLNENLILYRSVSKKEFEYWKKSSTLETYKSTSLYEKIYGIFDHGYKIKINAPAETKGYYIGNHSLFDNEKEFLLHRGQKYKILNIKENMMEVEIDI